MAPKTAKSRRVVPLAPGSRAVLEAQRQINAELRQAAAELWNEEDLIFPGTTGPPKTQAG